MQKRVATLEPHEHDIMPHPSNLPVRDPGGRFQYAGGARPLAGYTIKRGVGQGGFGEIYYATNDAGKDVALKLVRRNLEVELRGIRQCLNLRHPHLLDLYDIRQDDHGDTWVVMEYIAGENLEDFLAERPEGLPPQECLVWIHGIGAAVAYLHERGIVHRDLKPGNIFCDEGVVKVGDYGLSKFISCSRRSGHTESIGTVHYMAPEVANGRYGKEIDVYALGVILYELLTGRVPFEGESVGEVLMKHLTARPDVSMLAEPYRGVVARAMEKDPALRYRSATEMLATLPAPPNDPGVFNHINSRGPTARGVSDADSAGRPPPAIDNTQETVVDADVVTEEPVLRAVRENVRSFRRALQEARQKTPTLYVVLMIVAVIALIEHGQFAPRIVVTLAALYCVYRVIWTMLRHRNNNSRGPTARGAPPTASTPHPETSTAPPDYRSRGLFRRHERPIPALALKPPRERLADLIGSLLGSTLVAAAMCVVVMLIESFGTNAASIPRPEQFAWLFAVGVIGAWAVLIPSKLWEGVRGEAMIRRFLLMVIGMAVGAAAFGMSELLVVGLPPTAGYPAPLDYGIPPSFYGQNGRPLLLAHVACFGTLFLLVRWWLQADPWRSARLSLWKLILSVSAAGVVAWAWQFPQPWLPMVAATISVSVQLASPWTPASQRWRREME